MNTISNNANDLTVNIKNLMSKLSLDLKENFTWKKGKLDGQLYGIPKDSYKNFLKFFIKILKTEDENYINTEIRQAEKEFENVKGIFDKYKKEYEKINLISISNEQIYYYSDLSFVSGIIFLAVGIVLIFADFPFSLLVADAFNLNGIEKWLLASGIALISFFFKFYYEKHFDKENHKYFKLHNFLLILIIIIIIILGLFRSVAYEKSKMPSNWNSIITFIPLTLIFPILGAIFFHIGSSNIFKIYKINKICKDYFKYQNQYYKCLYALNSIKDKKGLIEEYYFAVENFLIATYDDGFNFGFFTPEKLEKTDSFYNRIKNWINQYIALKRRYNFLKYNNIKIT